jgi:hypothetical protein
MKLSYRYKEYATNDEINYNGNTVTVGEDDIYVDFIISNFNQFYSKVLDHFGVKLSGKLEERYIIPTDDILSYVKHIFVFDQKYLKDTNIPIQFKNRSISIYRSQFNVYEDILYFTRDINFNNIKKDNPLWSDIRAFFKILEY